MAPPILTLQDIRLSFGGEPLLDGAELSVSEGDRLCLVGRNGSGKSTLLKIAAGLVEPASGERFLHPRITVRYLPQEPDLSGFQTTRAYVEAGLGPGDDPHRAQRRLDQLGLTGDEDPARLSGGEARRAALARVLAPEPDILLLDEPTNHLDLPAIEWLEDELQASRAALVLISHDRRFLENLSRATIWLSNGQTRRLDRGFGAFESWRDTVLEQEALDRHKLDRKIAAETDWLRTGVTARRKRNQGRLRALYALREERRRQRRAAGAVNLAPTDGALSGKRMIEAEDLVKAFDGRPVVDGFSTRVQRGDRVGIVGPNGAGKTTLLNLLTGALGPDAGAVRLGANLQMVTLDQRRESLDADTTLAAALTGGRGDTVSVGGKPRHVIGYMKDFLFAPEQKNTPVGVLSGGERGRLMLARALARPANLLVLDEPTNDLDIETLDLLQEMLAEYSGTVLLVSHDRDFLDRVVTSVIAWEGDGQWVEYAGGYTDMLAQRAGRTAPSDTTTTSRDKPRPAERTPRQRQSTAKRKQGLTFKERHELEKLPGVMDALKEKVSALRATLDDPALYARDRARFDETAAVLQQAETELAAAEERWLTLELKREEGDSA